MPRVPTLKVRSRRIGRCQVMTSKPLSPMLTNMPNGASVSTMDWIRGNLA